MSRPRLETTFAELAANAQGNHPPPGELIDYHQDRLDSAERARLAAHLCLCEACSLALFDLEAGPNVRLRNPDLERSAHEEQEDWNAILRGIDDVAVAPSQAAPVPAPPAPLPVPSLPVPSLPVRSRQPAWVSLALAASLLVAALLVAEVLRLRSLANLPRANAFVADLLPEGTAGTRGAVVIEIPAGTGTAVFLLATTNIRPFPRYAAELHGPGDRLLWQNIELRRAAEGGFSLAVPPAALPEGEIEIHLFGLEGSVRQPLAIYRTRIINAHGGG